MFCDILVEEKVVKLEIILLIIFISVVLRFMDVHLMMGSLQGTA